MIALTAGKAIASMALVAAFIGVGAVPANASVCDGVTVPCKIGDIGPGGGIVVYDAGSQQPWGRYLEAAQKGWADGTGDPLRLWCDKDKTGYDRMLRTGTAIGTGAANTKLVISACGKKTAAGAAAAYRGGGLSDWFLPSKSELNQVFLQRKKVGGFTGEELFWSSSQATQRTPAADLPSGPTGRAAAAKTGARGLPVSAWAQDFMTGEQQALWKWGAGNLPVRPVRAF